MMAYLVARIEDTRTLYHTGFADDGRPIWTNHQRQAMQHEDAGQANQVMHQVAEVPWARPGYFGVGKVGGRPTGEVV